MTLHREEQCSSTECEPLKFRALEQVLPADAEVLALPQHNVDPEQPLREAYERGRRDGSNATEAHYKQALQEERAALLAVMQQVEREKQKYFADVEAEVVTLALSIAERVLHREAEMDPTLLAGAARVALEQIQDTSDAVLRVSAGDKERWRDTLAPLGKSLQIEADEGLPEGEAVLRMRSGTIQLGLRAQLKEIELGFFELLSRRPASMAAA